MPASAVDTFLSTVVSKTVPLLQNKQLNYPKNDIRLAKFREKSDEHCKKRIARLTRTNADKFAYETAHRQDFCTFRQSFATAKVFATSAISDT